MRDCEGHGKVQVINRSEISSSSLRRAEKKSIGVLGEADD
jgi:hypothetical protein